MFNSVEKGPQIGPIATKKRKKRSSAKSLVLSLLASIILTVGAFAAVVSLSWTPRLGLDLAGGLSVVYQPQGHPSKADMTETVAVLTARVNGLGVSGAQVVTQGKNIVVSVPGVGDAHQVLASIGQTAQLLFRPVICYSPEFVGTSSSKAKAPGTKFPDCPAQYQLTAANLQVTPRNAWSSKWSRKASWQKRNDGSGGCFLFSLFMAFPNPDNRRRRYEPTNDFSLCGRPSFVYRPSGNFISHKL